MTFYLSINLVGKVVHLTKYQLVDLETMNMLLNLVESFSSSSEILQVNFYLVIVQNDRPSAASQLKNNISHKNIEHT